MDEYWKDLSEVIRNWATFVTAVGALMALLLAAYHYKRQRAFELLKHIEDSRVREARRRIMLSLPLADEVSWIDCDVPGWKSKLNEDAATVCAAYNNLAAFVLPTSRLSRLIPFSRTLMNFFVDNWGESIIRTHARLKPFIDHRQTKLLQRGAYKSYSKLAKRAKKRLRICGKHIQGEMKNEVRTEAQVMDVYGCASPLTM